MRFPRLHALTVCAAVVTALAGCAGEETPEPEDSFPHLVRLYGTDGTMQNAFADNLADPSVLSGMKGTTPLTDLSPVFTNRLLEIDPDLQDFNYAGETYDAVVIVALAAELAGTPEPETVRHYIKGVTAGGEPCDTVERCLELARAGEDLQYRGVALRQGGLTDAGEPAMATYGTQHFGPDGRIDQAKTEFVGAGDPSRTTTEPQPTPGPRPTGMGEAEPLRIGTLLPKTGDLAFAYPPMFAAAELAVSDINAAGGVLGQDVELIEGDDGTRPEVARQTVADHIDAGVHVIIGAGASRVTAAVLPDVVAAKRILFTPASTAHDLMGLEHDGYLFRTAPSDLLQGAALADMIMRDGVAKVAVISREDAYGDGLRDNTVEALRRFGVPPGDIVQLSYPVVDDPSQPIPGVEELVRRVVREEPDGILVIGFAESAQIIQALVDAGIQFTRS